MRNKMVVLLVIVVLFMFAGPARAQCAYEWCDAPWPPPAGSDRTVGKDNCKLSCAKIAKTSATSYRIYHSTGDTLYYTDIPADDATIIGEYVVLKFQGKVVAQFLRVDVTGWKQL